MASTRSLLLATLAGAAALLAAALAIGPTLDSAHRRPPMPAVGATTRTAQHALQPPAGSASRRAAPAAPTTDGTAPAPTRASGATAARPAPAPRAVFGLTIATRLGIIATSVAPLDAASNQPVDPPHQTAAQWNTAAWIRQSAYPSADSSGTSYIYGHACHHHLCAFTQLRNARIGDQITVATDTTRVIYRIDQVGLSPKNATTLPRWVADSTVPGRLVLVTCAYEHGDTSTDNIVVLARLQPGQDR